MTNAEHVERQALGEIIKLIKELIAKEEEKHEHYNADNRRNTGQPEETR